MEQASNTALSHENWNSVNMVPLYPALTILSETTTSGCLTDNGARFSEVMISNDKIKSIAHHYAASRFEDSSEPSH